MYTVAAPLAASYKDQRERIVEPNNSREFHLLHNRVVARGNVVFNPVLRLQWALELRVDAVVGFIVGKQPSVRSPLESLESHWII